MPTVGCELFSICPFPHWAGTGVRDPGNWGHSGDAGWWPGEGCHITLPCWTGLDWAGWVEEGNPKPAPRDLLSLPGKGWILVP